MYIYKLITNKKEIRVFNNLNHYRTYTKSFYILYVRISNQNVFVFFLKCVEKDIININIYIRIFVSAVYIIYVFRLNTIFFHIHSIRSFYLYSDIFYNIIKVVYF